MTRLSLDAYLPHCGPMRVIDTLIDVNDVVAITQCTVREDHIFYDATVGGIPAWFGIELMAQTVAVFAGFQNPSPAPAIGLLLSVRQFSSTQACYPLGTTLMLKATKSYLDANVGVFDTEIYDQEQCIAVARLNTYQPDPNELKTLCRGEQNPCVELY